jgi:flavodoxin
MRSHAKLALARRSFLRLALLGAASVVAGCRLSGLGSSAPAPAATESSGSAAEPTTDPASPSGASSESPGELNRVLIAYFSRAGENYFNGGRTFLEVGNTEVLASMIGDRVPCDIYRIQAVDPYPESYDETVTRNVEEQEADARPAIANPLGSIDQYDTILLGSPIWNVRAPLIMSTFTESFDFSGKTVHPFTTHAMSGLGTTDRDYAESCAGATIGDGLAVRGEEVGESGPAVESWLQRIGLL